MNKLLATTLFLLLFSVSGTAQQLWKMRRVELSAGIGTTQFFGDIGGFSQGENSLGFKDFILSQTRLNIDAAAKYRILNPLSVRLNLGLGYFHSSDAKGSNTGRAFESKTNFFEPSVIAEYYFFRNSGENSYHFMKGSGYRKPRKFLNMIDIYVFTGVGEIFYKVNPNTKFESYMTGSGGSALVIPAGLGASLISSDYSLGVELGGRYTFSDNIDGYASKYSKSNDIYYLLNFTFTYKIKTKENGLPVFMAGKNRRR